MDQAWIRFPDPDTRPGALILWGGLSATALLLSYLADSPASLINRAFFAVALSLPILAMASRGHFGSGCWSFPTIPAQVYLIWNLGLLPSLAGAAFEAQGQYHYGSSAKWVGASAFLIWFLAFAVGSGGARPLTDRTSPSRPKKGRWDRFDLGSLMILIAIWLGCGVVAAKLNALSSWTQINISDLQGSPGGAAMIFYWAFVPLIPILGLSLLLFGRTEWRWIGVGVLALGAVALMVFSNRRLAVYLALLILFILSRAKARISLKYLVTLALAVGLLLGPLIWPIRIAATRPDLFRTEGHPVEMVKEAVVRYVTDSQFRGLVSEAGQENLQGGRFNYADTYLAGVQWVQDHGAYKTPSFLYAPVIMTPSAIWFGKTQVADALNIKRQFNKVGIANTPDFAMSPMLESIFEFGILGVACFGFLWGLMSKTIDRTFDNASGRLSTMVLWAALYLGILAFEAYISAFVVNAREAILTAVILGLGRRLLIALGYLRPSPGPTGTVE